jgi:phosphoserine aminotransferase
MPKTHNFSAGPSVLPAEVLEKAAEAVKSFTPDQLSLIEVSHRSGPIVEVMENARQLVKELLGVPEGYSVLFLQGGASLGFVITAYNFMKLNGSAAYVNTGVWAKGAIAEAKLFGEVKVVASSEDKNFNYVPSGYGLPTDSDYLHITSNNTIYGTQCKRFPVSRSPIVCDMSSDIFSRKINVADFGMIYAGAQKNMGPAGTTLYIVKDELLGKTKREIPSILNLQKHIAKDSMLNTPPVFAIYTSLLTLEWLKNLGGVEAIEKINEEKAALLYDEIDRNPLFVGAVDPSSRSLMNVTFLLNDERKKEAFDNLCKDARISGIKGHRSVGGYRASLYNALPKESVQALVNVMKTFEQQFG